MRAQVLNISDLAGDTWITGMLQTGFESNKYPYRIVNGLPKDAKLIEIKVIHEPVKCLQFLFESSTFEDVPDPYSLPSMTVVMERIP